MAKHRRRPGVRARRRARVAAVLRGTGIVGVLVVCVFAGAKLFSFAASSTGIGHAAAISGPGRDKPDADGARGREHGSDPGSGQGSATPAPSSTPSASSSPGADPSATATALPNVSGQEVTAVGDSVMVAATPALDTALPGIEINAMVGRQFYTGLQVIEQLKEEGQLRKIVVVGLGTNGTVTTDEISQLFTEIGPNRLLVLVNTYEARSWEQEVNSTLATAAADHPGSVALANWYDTIEHRTDLLWPDGIHPQPAGGVVYAKMLKAAVDKVASLPG
jgi:hypothetical protein